MRGYAHCHAIARTHGAHRWRRRLRALLLGFVVLLVAPTASALDLGDIAREFFPEANDVGPLEGQPPAREVRRDGEILGYVFRTDQIAPIPAYSGQPVAVAVGLQRDGRIRALRIVAHQEPILLVGVDDAGLNRYVDQYRGLSIHDRIKVGGRSGPGVVSIDAISGATITVMVINASITRAAKAVAESRGLTLDAASVPAASERLQHPGTTAAPATTGTATTTPADAGHTARTEAPASLHEPPADAYGAPLWPQVWEARTGRLWILGAGLFVLTTVLVLQDWLTRHPTLVTWVRNAFLTWTLLFVGWFALGQLSVVNVFTFMHAITHEFRWDTFLIEPLIFVLWGYVAITLVLWGRGVYCGWLCPFGALQELVNKLAQWLHVPQFAIPALVHERLLAIKYIVLLGLFGLSLQSMPDAVQYAEIEPFKTAITLRFDRAWPFVLYALGLVAVSVVNGKFFCKYLCPLGAALTIPAHFRIFDWLRRRRECGNPCQTCYVECPSQAIRPTGEINANECHYCLDCQITYWNAYKCPPLVERRKRAERRGQKLRLRL